jgi:hypothetical protein
VLLLEEYLSAFEESRGDNLNNLIGRRRAEFWVILM